MILSDASSDEDDASITVMSRYGIYHHSWLTIVINYFQILFLTAFLFFFLIIIYECHNIFKKFSEPPKTTRGYRRKVSPPSSRKSHTSPQASSSSKPGKRKVNDLFDRVWLLYVSFTLFYLLLFRIHIEF